MKAIDEPRRRTLLLASAVLCAVPVALTPLAARSSFEPGARPARFASGFTFQRGATAVPAETNAIRVSRDPFAQPVHASIRDVTGMRVVQGAPTGIRVPDRQVRVTAIVEGNGARALVEENGIVRVVAAGEMLAGALVLKIDPRGIRLSNGALVKIANGTP